MMKVHCQGCTVVDDPLNMKYIHGRRVTLCKECYEMWQKGNYVVVEEGIYASLKRG